MGYLGIIPVHISWKHNSSLKWMKQMLITLNTIAVQWPEDVHLWGLLLVKANSREIINLIVWDRGYPLCDYTHCSSYFCCLYTKYGEEIAFSFFYFVTLHMRIKVWSHLHILIVRICSLFTHIASGTKTFPL